MSGGYRFTKMKTGALRTVPEKNDKEGFSHVADDLQYVALVVHGGVVPEITRRLAARTKRSAPKFSSADGPEFLRTRQRRFPWASIINTRASFGELADAPAEIQRCTVIALVNLDQVPHQATKPLPPEPARARTQARCPADDIADPVLIAAGFHRSCSSIATPILCMRGVCFRYV
jgi:hypothetical protein